VKSTDRYFVEGVYCIVDGETMRVVNLGPGELNATLLMDLKLRRQEPFRVIAEVTWVNDPAQPTHHDVPRGFGVRFTRITAADGKAIIALLRHADPVLRKPPG